MRVLAVVAGVLFVAGCGALTQMGAGEVVSLVTTDKTMGDHVISWASGKNCSTVRSQADLTYCADDEPFPRAGLYCYRTLAAVTCYDRPQARYQKVDLEYENAIKRTP